MSELKMLENVLKPKETATVQARKHFLEDWEEIGAKMAKKGRLLPKSGINSELVSNQRVKTENNHKKIKIKVQSFFFRSGTVA